MHNSRQYNIPKILNLSMDLMLWPASWSVSLVMLHEVGGMGWLSMPWLPMSVLGIAVAFYIGFKNNSSYDRTWEARKIWGGIVNASRAWAYGARDLIGQPFEGHQPLSEPERAALHRQLVYRHVAWLDDCSSSTRPRSASSSPSVAEPAPRCALSASSNCHEGRHGAKPIAVSPSCLRRPPHRSCGSS